MLPIESRCRNECTPLLNKDHAACRATNRAEAHSGAETASFLVARKWQASCQLKDSTEFSHRRKRAINELILMNAATDIPMHLRLHAARYNSTAGRLSEGNHS